MTRSNLLVACLSLLGLTTFGWSQTGLTSLRGTVTDPSGALLAGAEIVLEEPATGFRATRSTDQSGAYEFPQIPPGKYTVTVTKAGFGKRTKAAELLVSQPATINFALSVQTINETIEVSDVAQTVNTTDATIGNAVSNSTIQALPIEGRNVPDLLSLQPGVVYLNSRVTNPDQDSRSGAVSGARSDQSNVTLDGVDNNDQRQGYAFTGVLRSTLDSVEEFRVSTTNSNADSGRSSGAQVTLVTKSGTNKFHGSAYEYNRNNLGLANDWFNKNAQISAGLPNKPGQLIRNTFGVTFGGPIKKDKVFFFLNYEGQKTQENQQQNLTVPTAAFKSGMSAIPVRAIQNVRPLGSRHSRRLRWPVWTPIAPLVVRGATARIPTHSPLSTHTRIPILRAATVLIPVGSLGRLLLQPGSIPTLARSTTS